MGEPVSWVMGAVSLVGAVLGAGGSYQQANAQKQQAEFEAQSARRNAEIMRINAANAEAEGKEAKQIGEENAARKRQEAALMIGKQRSAAGASGATVDSGGFMDVYQDTAERGAIDALAQAEEGQLVDHNKRVEAWNINQQAAGQSAQASMSQQQANHINPWLSAGGSLLSGAVQAGSSFYSMNKDIAPRGSKFDPSKGWNKSNFLYARDKTASNLSW